MRLRAFRRRNSRSPSIALARVQALLRPSSTSARARDVGHCCKAKHIAGTMMNVSRRRLARLQSGCDCFICKIETTNLKRDNLEAFRNELRRLCVAGNGFAEFGSRSDFRGYVARTADGICESVTGDSSAVLELSSSFAFRTAVRTTADSALNVKDSEYRAIIPHRTHPLAARLSWNCQDIVIL